jgi:hypothetical protein
MWNEISLWDEISFLAGWAAVPAMAKVAVPATPSSVAPTTALIRFEYLRM